jgi:hypothetical protein
MNSPFAALALIAANSGMEPREFIALVNAHIDALTAWEARRATVAHFQALRRTAKPARIDCDSDDTFASALKFWEEAQTIDLREYAAPSASIPVERAIEVHIAADGSRTYTYIGDEWGIGSVYRDNVIQRSKEVK